MRVAESTANLCAEFEPGDSASAAIHFTLVVIVIFLLVTAYAVASAVGLLLTLPVDTLGQIVIGRGRR